MLTFMEEVARKAGEEALSYFHHVKSFRVDSKSTAKDLVSTADRAVEGVIIGSIHERYPSHGVFGEESGRDHADAEYCWVIDPIDGTQSFVKGHPYFSISLALKHCGRPVAGCVYAPALGVMFTGDEHGAFENGEPIRVSGCSRLEEAACATGFACVRAGLRQNNTDNFARIVPQLRDIKRCGSAALDLCYTGAGTFDGYWEYSLAEYDVAAGALICRLAGGKVCDWRGGDDYPAHGIVAGPAAIVDQLLPQLVECH